MSIYWFPLFLGLLLGFVPPRLLLNSECRYLTFEEFWFRVLKRQGGEGRRRRWWKLPLVWIDPVRGYVAAWMLLDAFEPAADASGLMVHLPSAISCGLIMLAVAVQTTGRAHERESLSPGGFVAGAMLRMLPPQVSIAVLVIGASASMAIQGYAVGYLAACATMAVAGFLFMGKSVVLLGALGVMMMPVFLNWFRGTRMVMPVRC